MPAVPSHSRLWAGIDELARRKGLSASGLAKAAGLDPTAFNKSKRVTPQGRPRWPSTESLWRVMRATGASLEEMTSLIEGEQRKSVRPRPVPFTCLSRAGAEGCFDDLGHPAGSEWDEAPFPDLNDENAYALEVTGDDMAPVYRDGDIIIVSPAASIRRGDRVVVKTTSGEVMARVLTRRTAKSVDLQSFNPVHGSRVLSPEDVLWMARIVWASQ